MNDFNIKYRAWLKEKKKMIDVCMIDFDVKRVCTKDNNINLAYDFDDVDLMLGFVLDDKILFFNDFVEIHFNECELDFRLINDIVDLSVLIKSGFQFEVIGNLYETPDLLEEKI